MHIRYKSNFISGYGVAGVTLLAFWLFIAIFGSLLSPYSPDVYVAKPFLAPSASHWLGTNDVGQDVACQLMAGARTSLLVAAGAATLSTFLAMLFAAIPAFWGGVANRLSSRIIDIGLVIPPILAAMLAAAYLQPGPGLLIGLLAFFFWPGTGRIVRAQTLLLKTSAHVDASRSFGASPFYLFWRHIFPDLFPTLAATIIHDARRAVFLEAGLAFLGISDPTAQSWGRMIQQALAFTYMDAWRWWLISPGFAISTTILGLGLSGTILERANHSDTTAKTYRRMQ